MVKKLCMIAGPNGAGKTTTALRLIPNLNTAYEFINADEIANGLAPFHPESVSLAASKLMISRLQELLRGNKNFAFETTAAGTNYIKYLKEALAKGYQINLVFLWLSSPALAIHRVEQRVVQGGHNVPSATIKRRYYLGLKNLIKYYLPLAHQVMILDNSISQSEKIIASKEINKQLKIEDINIWEEMKRVVDG